MSLTIGNFETDFLNLMAARVVLLHETSRNNYGEPVTATGETLPARVNYKSGIIRRDKETITYSCVMWLPPPGYLWGSTTVPQIVTADRVQTEDGKVHRVVDVDMPTDDVGVHHQKAWVD